MFLNFKTLHLYPSSLTSLRPRSHTSAMAFALPTSRSLANGGFRHLPSLLPPAIFGPTFQPRLLPAVLIPDATLFSNVSGILSSIWDSILLAVPKKRSSYQKKRSRQMAGKALKDLINLNRCSGCGRIKRMHILCPYCVASMWKWSSY